MAVAVRELGRRFAEEHRFKVEYDLGDAETLLTRIRAGVRADVLVCHDPAEARVKAAGCGSDAVVIGHLEPVVAVRPGNPCGVRTLADLARPGLKLGVGDPHHSVCGELFVGALTQRGLYDAVLSNVVLQARSHVEIVDGLLAGPLDAVVVWNVVVGWNPGRLERAPVDVGYPATRVTALGLAGSRNPAGRDAFLRWCRQPMARAVFRGEGDGHGAD
jgi:molybdate transport system substrate-binding protein